MSGSEDDYGTHVSLNHSQYVSGLVFISILAEPGPAAEAAAAAARAAEAAAAPVAIDGRAQPPAARRGGERRGRQVQGDGRHQGGQKIVGS